MVTRTHDHGHGHSHGAPGWGYALFCAAVAALLVLYVTGVFTRVAGFDVALLLTVVAGFPLLRHALEDLLRGHFSSHLTIAIAAGAAVAIGEYFAAAEVMFIMLLGEGLEHFTVHRARRAIEGFVASQPRLARVLRSGAEVEVAPEDGASRRDRRGAAGRDGAGRRSRAQRRLDRRPEPDHRRADAGREARRRPDLERQHQRVRRARDRGRARRRRHHGGAHRPPDRRRAAPARADRSRRRSHGALLPAGRAARQRRHLLRHRRDDADGGGAHRRLSVRAGAGDAGGDGGGDRAPGPPGRPGQGRRDGRAAGGDRRRRLRQDRHSHRSAVPRWSASTPAPGFDADTVLRLAAAAEQPSEHLLGRAMVDAARARGLALPAAVGFEMRPGVGVKATIEGREVAVGSPRLLGATESAGRVERARRRARRAAGGFDLAAASADGQTPVVAMVDGRPAGVLRLRDPLRPEAAAAVEELRSIGVERVVMLTGDEEGAASFVARAAGIDEVHARLLPEDKVRRLRTLRAEGAKVLMAGDGVNDAPSLAAAEVGLAMGRGAADLSAEAAQVVFLRDRLDQIAPLLVYARKVLRRIRSSILVFAFGVNFAAVGAAALGYLTPAWAAVVHQGASLAVILNCVRLLFEGRAVAPVARRSRGRACSSTGSTKSGTPWSITAANGCALRLRALVAAGVEVGGARRDPAVARHRPGRDRSRRSRARAALRQARGPSARAGAALAAAVAAGRDQAHRAAPGARRRGRVPHPGGPGRRRRARRLRMEHAPRHRPLPAGARREPDAHRRREPGRGLRGRALLGGRPGRVPVGGARRRGAGAGDRGDVAALDGGAAAARRGAHQRAPDHRTGVGGGADRGARSLRRRRRGGVDPPHRRASAARGGGGVPRGGERQRGAHARDRRSRGLQARAHSARARRGAGNDPRRRGICGAAREEERRRRRGVPAARQGVRRPSRRHAPPPLSRDHRERSAREEEVHRRERPRRPAAVPLPRAGRGAASAHRARAPAPAQGFPEEGTEQQQ